MLTYTESFYNKNAMRPILISFVLPLSLLSAFSCQTVMAQHEKTVISSWSFEEVTDSQTKDGVSELRDQVYGKYSMVRDVEGNALRIDGFRTYICRDNDAPQISGAFKAEAWMALGVYPWYWGPLVEFRNSESEGYMLGVNHTGHLGMRLSAGDGWVSNISDQQLPLET